MRTRTTNASGMRPIKRNCVVRTCLQRRFALVKLVGAQQMRSALVGRSFGQDVGQLQLLVGGPRYEQRAGSWCRVEERKRGQYARRELIRTQQELSFKRRAGGAVEAGVPNARVA